jgi:hypothetical protein
MRVFVGRLGLLTVAAAAWLGGTSGAQDDGAVLLRLRGLALNLTGVGQGRSGDVEIAIERWSTDGEVALLRKAFREGSVGSLAGVLRALSPRAGYVRTQYGGASDLQYARELPVTDGGRRIVLATGRAGAPADGSNPRADVHEFLVVEVRLDKDGKGEGRTAGAERLRYNKETAALELDRYGTEPVWIRNLHVSPK